jgi:mannitol-1-phosphate 5-dehydrogenase
VAEEATLAPSFNRSCLGEPARIKPERGRKAWLYGEEAREVKSAVMYGAGTIGRGFIGQLLSQSGSEVVFVDVDDELVARLNADRAYPIRFVSNQWTSELVIENVRAVHGLDLEAVAGEIGRAEVMATAVGVNVLPRIARPIAEGLRRRWRGAGLAPLNVLICENLIGAGHYLRQLVEEALGEPERARVEAEMGFVEASIGRMVPVMTPEMQEGNLLRIWVEEYGKLPVDRDGFRGSLPQIRDMMPFSPFRLYIERKLFIHNMGHALTAYLGQQRGHRYVWEAVGDERIRRTCRAAMLESAQALAAEHRVDRAELDAHVEDLLARFGNRQLGDTLDRVGRDLQRKLAPDDRLVGAMRACLRNGVEPRNICAGIGAALRFRDPEANPALERIRASGPEGVLETVCCVERDSWEWKCILESYRVVPGSSAPATGA